MKSTSGMWWALVLALWLPAAHAQWLEASSDHFVIYSDQQEKQVAGFAERLELFHLAMGQVFRAMGQGAGLDDVRPSPSNRATIFFVSSTERVREIVGSDNRYMAGIYLPRAGATVALVPRLRGTKSRHEIPGEVVLFHEYAHHFMYGVSERAYPRWFVEGYAEFFSGALFERDAVRLGAPATYRAAEIAYANTVPIRQLLRYDGGLSEKKQGYDAFYGQSWALFHYLFFDPDRKGQLGQYQQRLARGESALEAAEATFGDLDRLVTDVERYIGKRTLGSILVDRRALNLGAIKVRPLRPAEVAMLPVLIESKAGVSREEAIALLPKARRVAAQFPGDAAVWSALAEAEFDAGELEAAIVAADKALALNPDDINAHVQKGYALHARAKAEKTPEAWKLARTQWVRANRVENDHPVPLVYFYWSYADQGERPPAAAVAGLERALEVAPYDGSLRWAVVQQMVDDGRVREAAATLASLAYSPHPGEHTDAAKQLMQELESRVDGVDPGAED
jgi:tetratricopeptide (TPR) repeat protein